MVGEIRNRRFDFHWVEAQSDSRAGRQAVCAICKEQTEREKIALKKKESQGTKYIPPQVDLSPPKETQRVVPHARA